MLSYRLSEIVKLCGKAKRIADVGCDHGKVLAELAKNKAEFLVATDISEPSVKKAEALLTELKFKNFSVRVGDGCQTLTDDDKLDVIVIAGMGGMEIIEILTNATIKLKTLVLQPQNNVIKLRQFLTENNFYIQTDKVVEDKGKFYNIIKVVKTNEPVGLSDRQLIYGKTNLRECNTHFIQMLEQENEKLMARLNNIKNEEMRKAIMQNIISNTQEIEKAINRR